MVCPVRSSEPRAPSASVVHVLRTTVHEVRNVRFSPAHRRTRPAAASAPRGRRSIGEPSKPTSFWHFDCDRTLLVTLMSRPKALYVASAALPLVPGLASIAAVIEPGHWSGITLPMVRTVTPDALLYSAACLVVGAPLAGVAVASRRSPVFEIVAQLVTATAIFCAASAALTALRLGGEEGTLAFVATSHAVLASAALALASLGALLGTLLRDPLDAAAIGVGTALTAAYGVLVAGAPVGDLSAAWLETALLASPLMTVATAAHVDLVRSDIWYQISPLAHLRLDYPAWTTACGSYLLAGCAGFFAIMWCRTNRGPDRGHGL